MSERKRSTESSAWFLLALAAGLSWLFWILAVLMGKPGPAPPTRWLHYLGGLMPLLVATALVYRTQRPEGWRNYWLRLIDIKRISLQWYAVVFLIFPTLMALSRSTLSAALLHFMVNFVGELLSPTLRAESYNVLLWAMTAVIITYRWGPKTLAQETGSRSRNEVGVQIPCLAWLHVMGPCLTALLITMPTTFAEKPSTNAEKECPRMISICGFQYQSIL